MHGRDCWALIVSLALTALAPAAGPPSTDGYGDSLPARARVRLGTLRWRTDADVVFVAFLPEGKGVLTVDTCFVVQVWELSTGKELRRFDAGGEATGHDPVPALSREWSRGQQAALPADGRSLAVVGRDGNVHLWDQATGKHLQGLRGEGKVTDVRLSANGRAVATQTDGHTVTLWDACTGKQLHTLKVAKGKEDEESTLLNIVQLSRDGRTAFVVPRSRDLDNKDAEVIAYDDASGKEVSRWGKLPAELAQCGTQVGLSPDGRWLALEDEPAKAVRILGVSTGQERVRLAIRGQSWSRLTFSEDGKHVLVQAYNGYGTVCSAETGKVVREVGKAAGGQRGPFLTRSPSSLSAGTTHAVTVEGDRTIRVVDLATGTALVSPEGHRTPVVAVQFTSDGKSVISTSADSSIRWWDIARGKEQRVLPTPVGVSSRIISADGRLVSLDDREGVIIVADTATDREVARFSEAVVLVNAVRLSPDGSLLAMRACAGMWLLDVTTGKPRHTLVPDNTPDNLFFPLPPAWSCRQAIFSLDGKRVAGRLRNEGVGVWDTNTGRLTRTIPLGYHAALRHVAFTPDGRCLVLDVQDRGAEVWELVGNQKRVTLNHVQGPPEDDRGAESRLQNTALGAVSGESLAISPDGRLLAQCGEQQGILLWDLRTGKFVEQLPGHRGAATVVAFSPDGNTLATGGADTTVLLWDLAAVRKQLPARGTMTAEELRAAWRDLDSPDGRKVFAALGRLVAAPGESVPFLEERLGAAPGADRAGLRRLLTDLDSDEYAVRKGAREELEKLGDLASGALQEARKDSPSAEVRKQAAELLGALEEREPTREQVRLLRAVEVLEKVGTPEARDALKAAAARDTGVPAAAARDALRRLGEK